MQDPDNVRALRILASETEPLMIALLSERLYPGILNMSDDNFARLGFEIGRMMGLLSRQGYVRHVPFQGSSITKAGRDFLQGWGD